MVEINRALRWISEGSVFDLNRAKVYRSDCKILPKVLAVLLHTRNMSYQLEGWLRRKHKNLRQSYWLRRMFRICREEAEHNRRLSD